MQVYVYPRHNFEDSIKRVTGIYPIIVPCMSELSTSFYSSDSTKVAFKYVTKDSKTGDPRLVADVTQRVAFGPLGGETVSSVSVSSVMYGDVDHRWDKFRAVCDMRVVKLDKNSATVRVYFSPGDYEDYTSTKAYFIRKCRDVVRRAVSNSLYYGDNRADPLWDADRALTEEEVSRVTELLGESYMYEASDGVKLQASKIYSRYAYPYEPCADLKEAVDLKILDAFPYCPTTKPFTAGASYKLRIGKLTFVSEDKLRNGTTSLKDLYTGIPDATQKEVMDSLLDCMSRVCAEYAAVDSYGQRIWCIGLMHTEGIKKEVVLRRLKAQDDRL